MGNMRQPAQPVEQDRIVWVRGSNGVETPKWLSTIQNRMDITILGPYVDGDQCYDDPDNKPKTTATTTKTTTTKKATEATAKE